MDASLIPRSTSCPPQFLPSTLLAYQVPGYGLTGGLAGLASASTFQLFTRLFISSPVPSTSQVGKALIHGMGSISVRFAGFALTRIGLQTAGEPHTTKGWKVIQTGLAGAGGGTLDGFVFGAGGARAVAAVKQGSRVGICFTSYAALSNYSPLHSALAPPPFPIALLYGTIAGAIGTTIMHPFDSSASLLAGIKAGAVPRGALAIGVVISVQNEAVRALMG